MTARKVRNEDGTFTVQYRDGDDDPWVTTMQNASEKDADTVVAHLNSEEPEPPSEDENLSVEEEAAKNEEEIAEAKRNGAPEKITGLASDNVSSARERADKARKDAEDGLIDDEELRKTTRQAAKELRRQYGFMHRANSLFKTIGLSAYMALDTPFRAVRYSLAISDAHSDRKACARAIKRRNAKTEKYREAAVKKIKAMNIQREIDGEPLIDENDWESHLTKRQKQRLSALEGRVLIKKSIYRESREKAGHIGGGWKRTAAAIRRSAETLAGHDPDQLKTVNQYKILSEKTADEDIEDLERSGGDESITEPVPEKQQKTDGDRTEKDDKMSEKEDSPATEPEAENKGQNVKKDDPQQTGKAPENTKEDHKEDKGSERPSEPAPVYKTDNEALTSEEDKHCREIAEAARTARKVKDKLMLRGTKSDKEITKLLAELAKKKPEQMKDVLNLAKSQSPDKEDVAEAIKTTLEEDKDFSDVYKDMVKEKKKEARAKNITKVVNKEQVTREDMLKYPEGAQLEAMLAPSLTEMSRDELVTERAEREKLVKEAEKALKKAKSALSRSQKTRDSNPDLESAQDAYDDAETALEEKEEALEKAKDSLKEVREEIKSRPAEQMQYAKMEEREKAIEKELERSERKAEKILTEEDVRESTAPEQGEDEKMPDLKISAEEKVTDVEYAADLNSAKVTKDIEETQEKTSAKDTAEKANTPITSSYTPRDTAKMSTVEKFNYNTAQSSFHSLSQLRGGESADFTDGENDLHVWNDAGVMKGEVTTPEGVKSELDADGIMDHLMENADSTRRSVIQAVALTASASAKRQEKENEKDKDENKEKTLI